jgi:GTP pyrophosphokinase
MALADKLAEFHDYSKRNEFFQALGEKIVLLGEKDVDELNGKNQEEEQNSGWRKFVPFVGKKKKEEHPKQELFVVPEKFNRKKPIFISEENINQYKFVGCCHPIPGDDALGYINNKNQVEIHKRACPVAAKLKSGFGNRILDIKWDMHKILYFDATIRISGIDRLGMLNEITQVISSQMNVNIHKLTITSEEGIFDGSIELRVHDRDNVRAIMHNLKAIPDLKEISEIM